MQILSVAVQGRSQSGRYKIAPSAKAREHAY